MEILKCAVCEADFPRGRAGPRARYCSAECRAAKSRREAREDGRAAIWSARSQERRAAKRPVYTKTCPHCSVEFTSTWSLSVICGSEECRKAAHRARCLPHAQRRRAQKRGVEAETFNPREVFERDGWLCGICHEPVDPAVQFPDRRSASLDHVVPLAHGGSHSPANTRCSHWICNISRGTRDSVPDKVPG